MPTRLAGAMKRLSTARERRRRAALGPPLNVDDTTLDALATVSAADMPLVEAFVRDAAGQRGADLLRAGKA